MHARVMMSGGQQRTLWPGRQDARARARERACSSRHCQRRMAGSESEDATTAKGRQEEEGREGCLPSFTPPLGGAAAAVDG